MFNVYQVFGSKTNFLAKFEHISRDKKNAKFAQNSSCEDL
jgi:hypothetical protein